MIELNLVEVRGDHLFSKLTGDWKKKVRERIRKCEQMIVICGEHTYAATGVNTEIEIAQDEEMPYFLLWGYVRKVCYKP